MTQVMALCRLFARSSEHELLPHRVVDDGLHDTTSSPCSSLRRAETTREAEIPLLLFWSMSQGCPAPTSKRG